MKKIYKKMMVLGLSAVMTCSMSVTAFAADGDFTGDTMTGTADKYYTVNSEATYTDVSAVKLTWNVPTLTYTSGTNKAWNTETLRWVSTAYADTTGNEVSFTLANRGSYEVKATAKFALDSSLTEGAATVAFKVGDTTADSVTIPSIVDSSSHELKNKDTETTSEAYITANCTKTITGTVTPDWSKLANTAKTKLGTYTVTLTDPNHVATSMAIATAPTKTTYTEGDTFDKTGATFTVTYSDGSTATKSANNVTCDKTTLTTDDTKVTFTYTEGEKSFTAEQAITVKAAGLTYTLTGSSAPAGTVLSANAMKASSTVDYTYDGKTYTAYNGYIANTAYANWADATAFVKLLNDNSYDGCTTWRLLSSKDDAKAWFAASGSPSSGVSGVYCLWSSVEASTDNAYYWHCLVSLWSDTYKACSSSTQGFVVVRTKS